MNNVETKIKNSYNRASYGSTVAKITLPAVFLLSIQQFQAAAEAGE